MSVKGRRDDEQGKRVSLDGGNMVEEKKSITGEDRENIGKEEVLIEREREKNWNKVGKTR